MLTVKKEIELLNYLIQKKLDIKEHNEISWWYAIPPDIGYLQIKKDIERPSYTGPHNDCPENYKLLY